eukprot:GHVL01042399.1.p1 GENE.GHVL01042399.1~~GHVL01042399.1.p1  ORF type:complete len:640 (+),score=148.48 GHVL01042399.1:902-2821(+)
MLEQLRTENMRLSTDLQAAARKFAAELQDRESVFQRQLAIRESDWASQKQQLQQSERRLEEEISRIKILHVEELRQVKDSKAKGERMLLSEFEVKLETARTAALRDKETLEVQFSNEKDQLRREHENNLQTHNAASEKELAGLKRQLHEQMRIGELMGKIQQSAQQVDDIHRKFDSARGFEESQRLSQLDEREKSLKDMEKKLTAHQQDIDDQRKRLTQLIGDFDSQSKDHRDSSDSQNQRLQTEHTRLIQLQENLKESDRQSKRLLEDTRQQLLEEKREAMSRVSAMEADLHRKQDSLEKSNIRLQREIQSYKESKNASERALASSAARVRESEQLAAKERQNILVEMQVMEEKKMEFLHEKEAMTGERSWLEIEKARLEEEQAQLERAAVHVKQQSVLVVKLHDEAMVALRESEVSKDHLESEAAYRKEEMRNMRLMSEALQQQKLELMRTETHLRDKRGWGDVCGFSPPRPVYSSKDPPLIAPRRSCSRTLSAPMVEASSWGAPPSARMNSSKGAHTTRAGDQPGGGRMLTGQLQSLQREAAEMETWLRNQKAPKSSHALKRSPLIPALRIPEGAKPRKASQRHDSTQRQDSASIQRHSSPDHQDEQWQQEATNRDGDASSDTMRTLEPLSAISIC